MTQLLGLFIALAGAGTLLYALEWVFAATRSQPLWREDSGIDLAYALLAPFAVKAMLKLLALAPVTLLSFAEDAYIADGFGPVPKQPGWLIALEIFLLADLAGYWLHRVFHHRWLWRIHAVHHSSTQLDWLSALRVHPVNELVVKLAPVAALAVVGFPPRMLAGYLAFLVFYGLLLHANLNWSFGPLRYVIANPLFHRWHHTREHEGMHANFAPLFPFIDLAFGTLYLPRGERPCRFGSIRTYVPQSFMGQLLFPFPFLFL